MAMDGMDLGTAGPRRPDRLRRYGTTPGVARCVDAQLPIKDRIVLHNLNGHAIAIKRQRLSPGDLRIQPKRESGRK
jgi:hypothetical protein